MLKIKNNLKKVFISGSNGFIGTNLKKNFKKRYNLITPSKNVLNLNDNKNLYLYLNKSKPEIIIHLATSTKFLKDPKKEKINQYTNTFLTTQNLVNNINPECKLIIFFGSIEEYGNINTPFRENAKLKPLSYYGKYKVLSYNFIKKSLDKKNINYLWIRPSLTYGMGDNKERFLGHIINSIKNNKSFFIRPGNQIRDYLHVNDLCKILIKIISNYKKEYKTILNLSSQNYIKLNKIPIIIEKIIQKKLNYKILNSDTIDINLLNSNKKLLKLFPNLKLTTFKNGLIKTLKDEGIIK